MNQRKSFTPQLFDQNTLNNYQHPDDIMDENPLCLCEYFNNQNQRVHMLMCCCSCDAMDDLCTSLLCCCCQDTDHEHAHNLGHQRPGNFALNLLNLVKETISDVNDRIRVPCPGGARKMNLDFFITFLSILAYVYIGTIGFLFSLLAIVALPLVLYTRFFTTRQQASNNRNKNTSVKMAYYFIQVSLIMVLIVFNVSLVDELEPILEKYEKYFINSIFSIAVGLILYLNNSDPGYLVIKNKSSVLNENLCKKCSVEKDPYLDQIGHCPQCSKCVFKRDHHCFWIDNCIGYLNHKTFLFFLIYLLCVFLYSFKLISRRLRGLECALGLLWYDEENTIQDSKSFSCLFDVYYTNFNRACMTLLFMQLAPLISYLFLIIIQQVLFISLGLTQYQLFRVSQKNIRFSLAIYLSSNLKLKIAIKNLFYFLTKLRRRSDINDAYFKQQVSEHDHFV